jgi:hypothetical protein
MKSAYTWIAGFIGLVIIGAWWFTAEYMPNQSAGSAPDSYGYACDNGSSFSMTPAPDLAKVVLSPLGLKPIAAEGTLMHVESLTGARFEGNGIVMTGAGEEVRLDVNGKTLICNPVPSTDMAPWNWGDAGEGGGVKQDVSLIVSESILGRWVSTDDEKFAREFESGGRLVDYYGGKIQAEGGWTVFAGNNAPDALIPYEADAVYIRATFAGDTGNPLTFKLAKLTPEELSLVYMDRGGALNFIKAQ